MKNALRALGASLLLTLVVGAAPAGARSDKAPVFAPPPRLATTSAELARTEAAPDFAAVKAQAVKEGDELLAHPVTLPDGFANWVFYFACPIDGVRLKVLTPTSFQCPICKRIYTDERTIEAYRALLHYGAESAALKLGWAYAYTGDDRYVAGVKRILLKLAHDYPGYPQRHDRWGHTGIFAPLGGRRYAQSLDEGVGAIPLAKAYDLTRNSPGWSPAEKKDVEDNFFRLTAQTLLEFNQGRNNHQTWYNAGLMAIGSVLGDAPLIEKVLTMRGGYYDQLERSIGSDGLWYEGSMAYHGYALQALMDIADTGRRLGLDLQDEPKLRSMFEGPLNAAYPNGVFPAINDSDPSSFAQFRTADEWAFGVYHEPRFAQAAAWGNPALLKQLLGANATPQWPISTQSQALEAAGLAILRQGQGEGAVCAFVDYGPHGGGHGHFDKLNLMLYANGREWLLDPGRLDYSHKEYLTWVKTTAAHNSVTLGGQSQSATTGKLLYLKEEKGFAACATQSDKAYPNALLTRSLVMTPHFLVDVYDVAAPEKTQIDWFAHAVVPALLPVEQRGPGTPLAPGEDNGYQHLQGGAAWTVDGNSRWDFVSDTAKAEAPRLRLWLQNDGSEQIFTSTGIGYSIGQKAPCLIRRRTAEKTRFVTVYDLSGQGNYITAVKSRPNGDSEEVTLTTTEGTYQVDLGPQAATCRHE